MTPAAMALNVRRSSSLVGPGDPASWRSQAENITTATAKADVSPPRPGTHNHDLCVMGPGSRLLRSLGRDDRGGYPYLPVGYVGLRAGAATSLNATCLGCAIRDAAREANRVPPQKPDFVLQDLIFRLLNHSG